MKGNPVLHKSLVVGVIVLFIGVGIQPALATVEQENIDTEYFDVTTEFIGLDKNVTVKLTQEQIQELDALFDSFRNSLNNSESYENTVELYNDMILQLDGYGLFGNFSITQIKELVTDRFQNPRINNIMNRLYDRIPSANDSNAFCLIAGRTNETNFFPPSAMVSNRLLFFIAFIFQNYLNFADNLILIFFFYNMFRFMYSGYSPFVLASGISFGIESDEFQTNNPAKGWVNTYGLNGQKKWEGSFYGNLFIYVLWLYYVYVGAIGFKGIRIYLDEYYYLGSATYVKIDYEKPY